MKSTSSKKRAGIGKEKNLTDLIVGLDEREIQRVAACAVLMLDAPRLDQLYRKLGKETGGSLRRILETHRKAATGSSPVLSKAKVAGLWERAWSEWEACIMESVDEEGKYVIQEHHWEAPYLSIYDLARDLEPIAARMRKLLKRVWDNNVDPNFSFVETLTSAVEEIGSGLPDWMDSSLENEGLDLGPEVTRCLLEWEWLVTSAEKGSAFQFAEKIRNLEESAKYLNCDGKTLTKFIFGLGDADQMDILQGMINGIGAPQWEKELGSTYSAWFNIYQQLCKRVDRPRYLKNCRKNIAKKWELALPILKDLLARKEFQEAIPIIKEGVGALLRMEKGQAWDPRTELLVCHSSIRYSAKHTPSPVPLLNGWLKVTKELGQDDMACALELQIIIYKKWSDWDSVLAAFRKVESSRFTSLCEQLFTEWRTLVVDESVGSFYYEGEVPESTWIHSLVDAGRAKSGGASLFRRGVKQWMEELEQTSAALKKAHGALVVLTLDLDEKSQLRKTAPTLHKLISSSGKHPSSVMASRRRYLNRFKASSLTSDVIRFWKRNIAHWVPDPAQAGSSYESCADWLAATLEMAPGTYKKIAKDWAVTHRRRRNLWKALKKRGLSAVGE